MVALWRGVAQAEGLVGLTLEPALLAGVEKKTIHKEEKKWGRRYREKKRKKGKDKKAKKRKGTESQTESFGGKYKKKKKKKRRRSGEGEKKKILGIKNKS